LLRVGADGAQISISYGATEFQGGLVECTPGAGFHNPLPAQLLIEVVDPHTHQPLPDGEPGWVVLTHLQRTGTVLLRYALGDTSVRTQQPCPQCGAITDRLIQTPHRVDALLKIKGMLVNPAVVVAALDALLGARAYQVQVLANRISIIFNFADFNADGGIDGNDIEAFFAAWESGELWADFNGDGGTDGADRDAFFARWEAHAADADLNRDGAVDSLDVIAFFHVWEGGNC
jgi:hypothetical protein